MLSDKPGICTLYKHSIDTGNAKPIYERMRPMPPGKREVFTKKIHELLADGIIEPSNSPWACNAFLIPKKSGSLRFVANFKKLNSVTIPDRYTMPLVDSILSNLSSAKYFSVLDFPDGFHHILLDDASKPKTSFHTPFGTMQYRVLGQGLCNGPASFQRAVDMAIREKKGIFCDDFVDDVIVWSSSFEEHMAHLHWVFTALKNAGFRIKPDKLQLCQQRIKLLGFIIEPGKVIPDPDKVHTVLNFPRPSNRSEIQRFLGFGQFYARFVHNFNGISEPLRKLLRKGTDFIWSSDCESAYKKLITEFSHLTELRLPDLNKKFLIQTDASDKSCAAILSQQHDGILVPVWFASRSLKPAEIKYSASEKELLAVIWACDKFHQFIELTPFDLETDCQALTWLMSNKFPTGRLARWFMKLQGLKFTMVYRPRASACMKPVDALSRIQSISYMQVGSDCSFSISREEFIKAQHNDNDYQSIVSFLMKVDLPDDPFELAHLQALSYNYSISSDGLLSKFVGSKGRPWEDESLYWRICIPSSFRNIVVTYFHADPLAEGHLGIRKTYSRLEQRVYFKNMRKYVQTFINSCHSCQESKRKYLPPVPGTSLHPAGAWQLLASDLLGPYPRGKNNNKSILVILDVFTKYIELFPLRIATAKTMIPKFWETFCRFGLPKTLLFDNGRQYTSDAFHQFCSMLNIFHISAYHAQANVAERHQKTMKSMIITFATTQSDWDTRLHELDFALRSAISDATGFSPAYLTFGREFRTPFDNALDINLARVTDIHKIGVRINLLHSIARDNLQVNLSRSLALYNQKTKSREFKVGDLVWLRTHFLSSSDKGFSSKLAKYNEGPYKVSARHSLHTYDLVSVLSGQIVNKVHINELTPFVQHESE